VTPSLEAYAEVTGAAVIDHLRQLAAPLRGRRVAHVNSTRQGGGVAEILAKLLPLKQALGLDAHWVTMEGDPDFFQCTKRLHNAIQGSRDDIPDALWRAYEATNARNAERLRSLLEDADFVFIHDPQPAPLRTLCPGRSGRWIWRCHIDASHPSRRAWRYLRGLVAGYDASIFSLADFAHRLPHPQYLIAPSIDPLSDKNVDLGEAEVRGVLDAHAIDPLRPILVQVSRFDRFKDPAGVIRAYRLVKASVPEAQLVLAGGGADDDPEGAAVLAEVRAAAEGDPDIHVLDLPPDAHRTINALQRAADLVIQKSLREGFGLTVTEALWKGKPVIGSDTGGIRLQVFNGHTGYLVNTPEGAAMRMRDLLHRPEKVLQMGRKAKDFVRQNFLITRHLREYFTVMLGLEHAKEDRIELA
jgi:trehalose synthase